jgi:hypothetical protein
VLEDSLLGIDAKHWRLPVRNRAGIVGPRGLHSMKLTSQDLPSASTKR